LRLFYHQAAKLRKSTTRRRGDAENGAHRC
jgi:hypothetical protein